MALSYAADIRPLFRDTDITCMDRKGVRLGDAAWMCDQGRAQRVYDKLSSGKMPLMVPGRLKECLYSNNGWMTDVFRK